MGTRLVITRAHRSGVIIIEGADRGILSAPSRTTTRTGEGDHVVDEHNLGATVHRLAADVAAMSSAAAVAEFRSATGGRVRGSAIVHDVGYQELPGGLLVPAPACHVGTGGWDYTRFRPTRGTPVTCRRCLRNGGPRAADPYQRDSGQLVLDLDELDRPGLGG